LFRMRVHNDFKIFFLAYINFEKPFKILILKLESEVKKLT
jgi:hypothetical protein